MQPHVLFNVYVLLFKSRIIRLSPWLPCIVVRNCEDSITHESVCMNRMGLKAYYMYVWQS